VANILILPSNERGNMKRIFAAASIAFLAGCSTPATQETAVIPQDKVAAADSNMVCELVMVTGSALPKKRCETPEEKERQRKIARETGDALGRSVIIQKKPGEL
jgi:hypothetical protein